MPPASLATKQDLLEGATFELVTPAAAHASARWRGRLKNGNPSGDFLAAPRCGAKTRAGCACRQPAMTNGRCRLHGGKSTGARTAEGRRRARATRLVHGRRTAAVIGLRSAAAAVGRRLTWMADLARELSAGHGVDRSDSPSPLGDAGRRRVSAAPQLSSRRKPGPISQRPALMDPRLASLSDSHISAGPPCVLRQAQHEDGFFWHYVHPSSSYVQFCKMVVTIFSRAESGVLLPAMRPVHGSGSGPGCDGW
jgi:hypothetical protein